MVDTFADPAYALSRFAIGEVPQPPAEIDIDPWSDQNLIYPFSQLLIPVALLGSDTFDVADADVSTLTFGPDEASPVFDLTNRWFYWLAHWDVNHDGLKDLLAYSRTPETGIALGATEACLTGEKVNGMPFEGCDVITTQPACGLGGELAIVLIGLMWLRQKKRVR